MFIPKIILKAFKKAIYISLPNNPTATVFKFLWVRARWKIYWKSSPWKSVHALRSAHHCKRLCEPPAAYELTGTPALRWVIAPVGRERPLPLRFPWESETSSFGSTEATTSLEDCPSRLAHFLGSKNSTALKKPPRSRHLPTGLTPALPTRRPDPHGSPRTRQKPHHLYEQAETQMKICELGIKLRTKWLIVAKRNLKVSRGD